MSLDSPRHETINLYLKQPENIPSKQIQYKKMANIVLTEVLLLYLSGLNLMEGKLTIEHYNTITATVSYACRIFHFPLV